jgi:hypothetical protein
MLEAVTVRLQPEQTVAGIEVRKMVTPTQTQREELGGYMVIEVVRLVYR